MHQHQTRMRYLMFYTQSTVNSHTKCNSTASKSWFTVYDTFHCGWSKKFGGEKWSFMSVSCHFSSEIMSSAEYSDLKQDFQGNLGNLHISPDGRAGQIPWWRWWPKTWTWCTCWRGRTGIGQSLNNMEIFFIVCSNPSIGEPQHNTFFCMYISAIHTVTCKACL